MWYSSPLSLRNDLSQPGTWHLYLLWSISMISSLGAKTKWRESTMIKPGQSKARSESSSLPKNTTLWCRPGLEVRLTTWSAVQRANYAVNTPTKAKLFERQLMLTQEFTHYYSKFNQTAAISNFRCTCYSILIYVLTALSKLLLNKVNLTSQDA